MKNKVSNKYGTKRENISTAINEGVKMRYKAAMANLFVVVVVVIFLSTSLCSVTKLQGSYFTTLVRDCSEPRLRF